MWTDRGSSYLKKIKNDVSNVVIHFDRSSLYIFSFSLVCTTDVKACPVVILPSQERTHVMPAICPTVDLYVSCLGYKHSATHFHYSYPRNKKRCSLAFILMKFLLKFFKGDVSLR